MGEGYRVRHHSRLLVINRGETYMTLIEVANSSLKQYYFDVQDCYKNMLDVGKCVDNLIEMQGESE